VHLDVKPDNVISDPRDDGFLRLIDFSVASKYLDPEGRHIPVSHRPFKGNIVFASKNCFLKYGKGGLRLVEPTRRDDVISMMYMLLFLLEGHLPWVSFSKTVKN